MRVITLIALLLCLALAVDASSFAKRKGGSSGGGGHGGGGGSHGGSGGGNPSGGGSSSSSKPSSSSGIRGGGGSSGKGSGSYGDRPPSYASLFPTRSGYNAGGRGIGTGDSSRPYTPPPPYSASANYATVSRGQTVPPYTFKSNPPTTYYASPYRTTYPGAWGYGYYPIYPYPYWAYGAGTFVGASYVANSNHHGIYTYNSEFHNITVVNATNTPLLGDQDIFNNGNNVTFVDFNNGTIQVGPCGNSTSTALQVSNSDCRSILLDIKSGSVVSGNAKSYMQNDITFFQLSLGKNSTVLRTQTISSTKKTARGGIVAGIVIGCVAFVVLAGVVIWLCRRWKRK
ncbi:hypothetical protein GGI25_001630 [Coemansia spiralis]|uniref:Uncharacterized protein n=2 Tax=Coemansia TaxID=4863 RepID=A0A9W8G9I7_9FUNG|nr:hypothetical protein EDC05_003343 [Coemansia umbellata]KAJ2623938.1 hypothetical protein GGI26_001953 [Coemansia sp. RSA 1358]KAJ2679274.1 hypothetical protein GGI25_001630 [Coemansia spiralis]